MSCDAFRNNAVKRKMQNIFLTILFYQIICMFKCQGIFKKMYSQKSKTTIERYHMTSKSPIN